LPPPNQVTIGDLGTYVPVEEPSTASTADSCTAAKGHHHSITRSARPSSGSGKVRPRVLAVFRLMTSIEL